MTNHLNAQTSGVYIISVTPFSDNGAIDFAGIEPLIGFYLERGVHGVTIMGMMGEAQKLSYDEQKMLAKAMLKAVDGRVPVVVGVSSPGFAAMADLSAYVMDLGAAGVMVAPPGTVKGDPAVKRYVASTVAAIGDDVPFVLQDFPLATGVPIGAGLIQEIAEAHASCVMLKHEDWPGMDKLSALRDLHREGARRISILTGNGGIFLPFELLRGADGAMTGFAYPELLVGVCALIKAGKVDAALDLFDAYLPLIRYEQQPGLGLPVRKHVLMKRGAIGSGFVRAPSPSLTSATMDEVALMMARLERSR